MSFLENQYHYLILLVFSIAYPLAQSFEWRISYYKKWKGVLKGVFVMSLIFIPWDIWFTHIGVWWFNPKYFTGFTIFYLPIEEWLFFLIVPFACIFIHEVHQYYIKKDFLCSIARYVFGLIAIALIIALFFFYENIYTSVTFSLTSISLIILIIKNPKWIGRFLLTYLISFLPFLLINGSLTGNFTSEAVVNYNPAEIIGVRITTIPLEDAIYNLLMLLLVTVVYEKELSNK